MSRKVEEVARAIYEAWAKEVGSDATWEEVVNASGDDDFPTIQKWYRMAFAEARAAIEAMRELTPEMDMAGQRGRYQRYGGVRTMWSAMIDEALREDAALNKQV